jgi:FixJ family two-component response regulator
MAAQPLICVVDDDISVRESLPGLLTELGFAVAAFSSAVELLASGCTMQADCLILDIAMPEMSGLDLQRELQRRGLRIPIIFITAHVDLQAPVRALDAGAMECLVKPFSQAALLEAIHRAIS